MDCTTPFDHALTSVPAEWKGPLVDVVDTAAMVRLGIEHSIKIRPTSELIAALTRLAVERHNRETKQYDPCQIMALRSAVDLLCGAYSSDEAEATLGDYRRGGERHDIAQSLYQLIDNL
jgi:hypothetical protein